MVTAHILVVWLRRCVVSPADGTIFPPPCVPPAAVATLRHSNNSPRVGS